LSANILVVDNGPPAEPMVCQRLRRNLSCGRSQMEFAPSGPAALARARDIQDPSLIRSDVNMPGMSGRQRLAQARARRPDVPVIMITADGKAPTRRKPLERGADGFLTGPIALSVLCQEIETRPGPAA